MLVSGVHQSDSVTNMRTHISFFRLFSMIGYYKMLNIVPYAMQGTLLCRSLLVIYFKYSSMCLLISNS